MRVPPVPGDLTPSLAVSYSSGSVDGRTSNTNSQPSWVGEGFDLWSGYMNAATSHAATTVPPRTSTATIRAMSAGDMTTPRSA